MTAKDKKVLARRFTSDEDRKPVSKQHVKPCAGCPWKRGCIPGYLGNYDADAWLSMAHGESHIDCHNTTNQQCAGAAIFRANVCKSPRDPESLRLPPDEKTCFATDEEFRRHHSK